MNIRLFGETILLSLLIGSGLCFVTALGIAYAAPYDVTPGTENNLSDSTLTSLVNSKLQGANFDTTISITVSTNQGVVTLAGVVKTAVDKSKAEQITRSIPGVKDVKNDLILQYASSSQPISNAGPATSDSWITTKVKSEILADIMGKGSDVIVSTTNGVVTLKGALKSTEAISHIKDIAAATEGVKSVDISLLTVASK